LETYFNFSPNLNGTESSKIIVCSEAIHRRFSQADGNGFDTLFSEPKLRRTKQSLNPAELPPRTESTGLDEPKVSAIHPNFQEHFWKNDKNWNISISELIFEKRKSLFCSGLFSYKEKLEWITDVGKIRGKVKIVVEKSKYILSLLDENNNIIVQYNIGIGKNPGDKEADGDMRTPEGEFCISQIQNSETWVYDFEGDGLGPIAGAYGPWFLRLETGRWSGIGIHGTHLSESIGTRCTHGCIRMKNEYLNELKQRVHIGTPVVIKK